MLRVGRLGRGSLLFALGWAVLAVAGDAPAQSRVSSPAAAASPEASPSPPTAAEARQRVVGEIDLLTTRLADAVESERPAIRRQLDLLRRVELYLTSTLAADKRWEELAADLAAADVALERERQIGPAEPPSRTLRALDLLKDQLVVEEGRAARSANGVSNTEAALARARAAAADAERRRRLAREDVDTKTDADRTAALAAVLREARLVSEGAEALVELRSAELRNERLVSELDARRLGILELRVAWVRARVQVTPGELEEIRAELEARERGLRTELEAAQLAVGAAETRWLEASDRAVESTTPGERDERLEARRLDLEFARAKVTVLSRQLQRVAPTKELWEARFELAGGRLGATEVLTWRETTNVELEALRRERELRSGDLDAVRGSLYGVIDRLEGEGRQSGWLKQERAGLEALVAVYEDEVHRLEAAVRLRSRFVSELGEAERKASLRDRLAAVGAQLGAIWRFELASIDDRPITVGKTVFGLLLLILGVYLSGFLSSLLGTRILPRLGLAEGAAAALQSVLFYLLVVGFSLLALHVLNVPLTAFTLLGGAFAIGLGFGSQNIINNFISGLILLAERPIRVGDLIQIENLYGTVQHIGARSTRVRTGSNVDIIVPNSTFLEQNVVNWTLSETRVRVNVAVGVAYGSPTREVARLLGFAAEEHGRVLKKPEPFVLFHHFGDNALEFEVHFWIRMRSVMDRRTIESDLRHRIDHLFREAGICIAYPQRDVHLDTASPLEVRVLPPQDAGDGRGA